MALRRSKKLVRLNPVAGAQAVVEPLVTAAPCANRPTPLLQVPTKNGQPKSVWAPPKAALVASPGLGGSEVTLAIPRLAVAAVLAAHR